MAGRMAPRGRIISVIPGIALRQVEVLRDGASAQYGSDAIAGVINFALKDDAEGAEPWNARYGWYGEDSALRPRPGWPGIVGPAADRARVRQFQFRIQFGFEETDRSVLRE